MYKGRLYYQDEEDHIQVDRFIERADAVSFEMSTTWGNTGTFSVDATAQLVDGYFTTEPVFARNRHDVVSPVPRVIKLQITHRTKRELTIAGEWIEAGESYPFEGDLKLSAL